MRADAGSLKTALTILSQTFADSIPTILAGRVQMSMQVADDRGCSNRWNSYQLLDVGSNE
jgi:hypothetical protein